MLTRFGITGRRELVVFVCLLLLVAVSPLGKEATHFAAMGAYRTLLLILIAIYFAWNMRAQLPRLCPYFLGAVAALCAIMTLSVLQWSGSRFEGFHMLYKSILFLAAFLVVAHAGSARPLPWKHAILGAVVLIDAVYIGAALSNGTRPLEGPFVNPNYLASFVLPGLAVCAAAVSLGSTLSVRIAAATAGAFLYYGIGQTASRGATLAALALLGLAGFRAARRYGLSWIRIGLAGLLLLALTLAANPVLVRKFADTGEGDPYNYHRAQVWLGTLSMIAENPVLGVGLGGYYHVSKQFTPPVEGTIARYGRWPNIAHSEYLQYAAEIGVPGALLLFGILGYVLLLAWRRSTTTTPDKRWIQEAAILAAVGLGLHALVDNNSTAPVLAAGLAVISQADLLPYRSGPRLRLQSGLWRPAMAMFLVALWTSAAAIPAAALYFNDSGQKAHRAGDFERAEENHRLALAFLPNYAVLLDNLGMVYFDEFVETRKPEHLDRAEMLFGEAMSQNPNYDIPAGHLEAALIQRLTGEPRLDLPVHRRIIEADRRRLAANPFNPFVRKNLAEAFYNIGDRERARDELLKAIDIEPNYVPGYLRLAEWYDEEGRLEDGSRYRNRAIQVVTTYKDEATRYDFEGLLLGRPVASRQP